MIKTVQLSKRELAPVAVVIRTSPPPRKIASVASNFLCHSPSVILHFSTADLEQSQLVHIERLTCEPSHRILHLCYPNKFPPFSGQHYLRQSIAVDAVQLPTPIS